MKLYAVSVSASFPDGPISSAPPHPSLDSYLHLVDPESRAKIRGFRLLDDARRCLLGRLLRQHVASQAIGTSPTEAKFDETDTGRPYVAAPLATGFDFNIAHDGDWVITACVDGKDEGKRVGVDVMTLRNPWEGETVETFARGISEQLTPAERAYIQAPALADATRLARALALWTLKEAYVKAIGFGLHFDLTRISFDLRGDLATTLPQTSLMIPPTRPCAWTESRTTLLREVVAAYPGRPVWEHAREFNRRVGEGGAVSAAKFERKCRSMGIKCIHPRPVASRPVHSPTLAPKLKAPKQAKQAKVGKIKLRVTQAQSQSPSQIQSAQPRTPSPGPRSPAPPPSSRRVKSQPASSPSPTIDVPSAAGLPYMPGATPASATTTPAPSAAATDTPAQGRSELKRLLEQKLRASQESQQVLDELIALEKDGLGGGQGQQ